MTRAADVAADRTPLCPVCGNVPFRKQHMLTLDDDGSTKDVMTLCVHCVTPLRLVTGEFEWHVMTEEETLAGVKDHPMVKAVLMNAFRQKREGTWRGPEPEGGHA